MKIHTAGSLPNRPTLYLPTGLPCTSRPTCPVPRPSHLPHTSQPAYPIPPDQPTLYLAQVTYPIPPNRPTLYLSSHLTSSQPAYPIPPDQPTLYLSRHRTSQPTYPIPRSPHASKKDLSRRALYLASPNPPTLYRAPARGARAPPLLMTPGILPRKARQAVSLAGSCWEI